MNALRERIEAAYSESGNALGWRFLYSPETVLQNSEVAFVGLNPGARGVGEDQRSFAMPDGQSAYRDERWVTYRRGEAPLQRQAMHLFNYLGVAPQDILAGNLVPFRSPDWGGLKKSKFSVRFGKALWSSTLASARPRLIVTMGAEARAHLVDVLSVEIRDRIDVGWVRLRAFVGQSGSVRFVGLPHLSRFQIFGRDGDDSVLRRVFGSI